MSAPKQKTELAILIAKVLDLVSNKPEKAAIILTKWVEASAQKRPHVSRKKAA